MRCRCRWNQRNAGWWGCAGRTNEAPLPSVERARWPQKRFYDFYDFRNLHISLDRIRLPSPSTHDSEAR